jgi:hypothetical protein
MKDLTVLTPPLLMAAAVVVAVVAFLRHEMGRGRARAEDEPEDPADPGPVSDADGLDQQETTNCETNADYAELRARQYCSRLATTHRYLNG